MQLRAPDDVKDWELNRQEMLQIPRLNLRLCAAHQYNLKIKVYQGFDLGRGEGGPAGDPLFKVLTPCGVVATDPFSNNLCPQWNAMLQIPFYEPTYSDLIICEVWDAKVKMHSRLFLSWKDIIVNQAKYNKPAWIDMYERSSDLFQSLGLNSILENNGVPIAGKGYEERSIYCGRVLLSMEIEERSFKKEPSPANIALKPKDCADMWSDPKQKMFFRFHSFYGQMFGADGTGAVLVEYTIGRKSVMAPAGKKGDKGLFEFFRSVELEYDLPIDDIRDNPDQEKGVWDPEYFISKLPDCIVKVYETGLFGKGAMIGMWQGPVKQVLGGGDPEYFSDNVFVGMYRDDNGTNGKFDGVAEIVVAPGDEAPEPSKKMPWGVPNKPQTEKIMNPYTGYQYVQLTGDANCKLGPDDVPGFMGFSCKLWLATRQRCGNQPPKGPPILSPWKAWNTWLIPAPWDLGWYKFFTVKGHIYQGQELLARNETGVANASVQLKYLSNDSAPTHTVFFTNHPTFDSTIMLNDIEIYLYPDDWQEGAEEFIPDAEDYTDVEKNKSMLRLSPVIECRVTEQKGSDQVLLGRFFIKPKDIFARKQDPIFHELFKSDSSVVEGHLLSSFQVIESTEKLMKEPPAPLVPDKSWVVPENKDTWCSKAPGRNIGMMECKIQIQVLGLRDLSSPWPFDRPIFQPQVEICCDDPATAATTKKTSRPSGQDANFLEVVEIDVRMPEIALFAPSLDFYVYDHSVMGIPQLGGIYEQLGGAPIVGYSSIAMSDYYLGQVNADEGDEGEPDSDDEDAKEKLKQKERKKLFLDSVKELKKSGVLQSAKEAKQIEAFFMKKDEAVVQAFNQYADAPDAQKFVERVESFLGGAAMKSKKGDTKNEQNKQPDKKAEDGKKKADEEAQKAAATTGGVVTEGGDAPGDAGKGGGKPAKGGEKGPATGEDKGAASGEVVGGGEGDLDKADKMDDDEHEGGDAQGEEEAEIVLDGEAIEGKDDELPDQQEAVNTPDGKPNAEWLLLRSHTLYDCELEKSTVQEYGKRGAWEPRFGNNFSKVSGI